MNTLHEEINEEMNKIKIWTVKAYVDYEHHVYAYTSLNKAIKKAYEIATEYIRSYEEFEGKGSFDEHNGSEYVFKYTLRTCKELVKQSMIETYAYNFSWSDSGYGYDLIYDIEIEGHDGKE
jgi:hypothetical protein